MLFGEYDDRWIAEHKLGPRTREAYTARLHVQPFLGQRELGKIRPDTVRTWRSELLSSDRSADTAAKAYRLVRAIMNTAVDDERIRRNPCRIKGADGARRDERPTVTVRQVYALAEVIGCRYRAFILTAALTGLRWGELIALRRMDIDLNAGTIEVRRAFAELSGGRLVIVPPKSEAGERTVTVPAMLVSELRTHLDEFVGAESESLVFTGGARRHPEARKLAKHGQVARG